MVSEYGIKLSTHLISSHFGDLVSKVCECLLRKGTLTIPQIRGYTELSDENVRKCLLVLIQHNCVQAFAEEQEGAFGEGNKQSVQYMALFDNILHRMRFAKFLLIVSEKLGKECEEVFEILLQHGRLTMEQVIDKAKSITNEGAFSPDPVRETFLKLVNARYVEHCPVPEPFLALPSEEELPAKKKGPKSIKKDEKSESIEQQAISAAAHMEAKRFLVITDTGTDVNQEDDKDNSPTTVAKGKRKHDAFEIDGELENSNREKEVLWRANFEEFARCLRHKACIANVRSWLDDGAAIVCSAILEATRSAEIKVKSESSVPLSLSTIHEEVMNSEAGRTMTLDHVRTCLSQLECRSCGNEKLYSLGLNKIIELAQNEEVESIVLKKYGRDAHRIFRLLSKDYRAHETDKISHLTFVEKKDAIKILYDLWKAEYLHMEKLLVSAQRQLQFLLWKVNIEPLRKHILDEMYHASLNLNQRRAYEQEQANELLMLPRDKLAGTAEKKYNRWMEVKKHLDSSLMKLDDALMLFHDF